MEFFEAVAKRRSIRRFKKEVFPDEYIQKALESAVLAPNSSNTQTWDFHWIQSPEAKAKVVAACLKQSAARTAAQLLVVTADPKKWKRSQAPLLKWVKDANGSKGTVAYYEKIVPLNYSWGFFGLLAPVKWLISTAIGLFRPITRGPYGKRDVQEVVVKSAALACENFVLAIAAQGGASCMMEGFDDSRLRKVLRISRQAKIVMVIGVGFAAEDGTWGPQFRLPIEQVIHKY